MRVLLSGLLLFAACAGPGRAKLAETPTAQSRANTGLAPPASQSDRDRSELVNSMDSMGATQRAYREADHADKHAAPPTRPDQPATTNQPASGARQPSGIVPAKGTKGAKGAKPGVVVPPPILPPPTDKP